jgi:hypothetical protein
MRGLQPRVERAIPIRLRLRDGDAEPNNMTTRAQSPFLLRNRNARRDRTLRKMAAMRAAKARKRLANITYSVMPARMIGTIVVKRERAPTTVEVKGTV